MDLHFYKYQGTGNDFVLIDNRGQNLENQLTKQHIAFVCDRRFGIGADGLMLLSDSEAYDFRMIYYNSDGGESTMCGNGGRCLVSFAHKMGIEKEEYVFEAVDGLHRGYLENKKVRLEMMKPEKFRTLKPYHYWIDTGSPHYVRFEEVPVGTVDVYQQGKTIRYSKSFADLGGTNVNFVNILNDHVLKVRTYERGVENETLSCGTGVTACAYTYSLISRKESSPVPPKIMVETEGGTLEVQINKPGTEAEAVFLIGPATFVFQGEITLPGE